MAKRRRIPMTLAIVPDRRWSGKLTVLAENVDKDGSRFVVAFDAEDAQADPQERYVFDHSVLSNEQLMYWTGVDVTALLAADRTDVRQEKKAEKKT